MPTATTTRATTTPTTSTSKDAPSSPAAAREEIVKESVKDRQPPERATAPERSADDLYDNIACTD